MARQWLHLYRGRSANPSPSARQDPALTSFLITLLGADAIAYRRRVQDEAQAAPKVQTGDRQLEVGVARLLQRRDAKLCGQPENPLMRL